MDDNLTERQVLLDIQGLLICSGKLALIEAKIENSIKVGTPFWMGVAAGLEWLRDDLLELDKRQIEANHG